MLPSPVTSACTAVSTERSERQRGGNISTAVSTVLSVSDSSFGDENTSGWSSTAMQRATIALLFGEDITTSHVRGSSKSPNLTVYRPESSGETEETDLPSMYVVPLTAEVRQNPWTISPKPP